MAEHTETTRRLRSWSVRVKLILSVIGILVGLSAGVVFSGHYHNYNSGFWGFASAIGAILALYVTITFVKQGWDENPRHLKIFMYHGCIIQLIGLCSFVVYLTMAITKHQGVTPYGSGYYLTAVWCFMTWKWGFGLFIYSRTFLYGYGYHNIIVKKGRHASYSTITEGSDSQLPVTETIDEDEIAPPKSKEPTPTGSKEPTPTGSKQPTPSGSKQPTPSGSKQPTPSGSKQPTPSGSKQPTPSGSKQSSPSGSKQSSPSGSKQPSPPRTDVDIH